MGKTRLFLLPLFLIINVAKDGECVDYKRLWKQIKITVCYDGYRNVTGECKPVCEPECFGTGRCVAPNKCECDSHWSGSICDEIIKYCKDGYWGPDCELACDCNASKCSSLSGECICQPGYKGLKCELSCSNGTFGENCSQACNCFHGDCHHVTGNCICKPGWIGDVCSERYCPTKLYDEETEECIDTPAFYIIISVHNIITIVIPAVAIILVVTITVIVYNKYKKPRYDGMINITAPKIHLRPPSISTQNQYQRPEHVYETIPDGLPPPEYQRLFRSDEVTDRIQDLTYFVGYERPTHVGNIEMQKVTPDYISLDKNSIPPQWPSNNNHYYQFRQQGL